jgi:hypothetical protein
LISVQRGDKERPMSSPAAPSDAPGRRAVHPVDSLSTLVGAHPGALREIFGAGRAADPGELGEAPRGRVLAFAQGAEVFLVFRPLLRALAGDRFPWRGVTFDHGGNSGQNVVFGRGVLRFRAEVGASRLDGRPALVLTYDAPAHENPWPIRAVRDELRMVGGGGSGVAIGPVFLALGGAPSALFWFGLEAARSG